MKQIGISMFTRRLPLNITTVVVSCFVVIFLASSCTARVATSVEPIQPPTQGTGAKSPARRIMDPAFVNAGKNPGLEIWRIENFKAVAYPQKDFGKFFTGDSYIVLNTRKDKNNRFSWDIHFWLGSQTSQDEAGSAAILTVQLDDVLNGVPVQHRETQDHESQLFLSYFKNGVRYQDGGVGSGFQHVQINAAGEKRLFQVKGKRNVRVRQVNLSVSSMNKGDCFILDAGNEILVYVGSGAKRVEKLKAISAANQIRDQDHNGRARVNIIDEFSTEIDKEEFFKKLGSGSPNDVPEESTAEDDATFETADERSVMLYKVSDQGGSLKVDTISAKPLTQQMLNTNDCFILDTGSGIYVWVGKKATPQEKSQSMVKAQDFLKSKKYPAWTHVNRIVEGAESAPFKQYFATWRDVGMSHTRLIRAALDIDSDVEDRDIDVTGFDELKKKGGRAMGFMPDNADGTFSEINEFVLINNELQQKEKDIHFSDLDRHYVYTFQYNYKNKHGEEGIVLYVWEGAKADDDTKDGAWQWIESKAGSLENCIVVRVFQGHEPRHFLKLFKGKLIITITDAYEYVPQLYRITGSDKNDVHSLEVEVKTSSLASGDVFALVYKAGNIFAWLGSGSNEFEKDFAIKEITKHYINKAPVEIQEGEEPAEFWLILGGEGDYDKSLVTESPPILEPRLFHCKILANGKYKFEEIPNYEQSDLDADDVMLLDGGDEVYAWVGTGTTNEEKSSALKMVSEYLHKEPSHRTNQDVPIIRLQQDTEPKCFKNLFPSWNVDYWKSLPSYDEAKRQLQEANDKIDNLVD